MFASIVFASHSPEVGVVAISFHRVATETKGLKIGDFVSAALISRYDVVHFQGAFVRGNPAQLATKLRILENLVAQGAADIPDGARRCSR